MWDLTTADKTELLDAVFSNRQAYVVGVAAMVALSEVATALGSPEVEAPARLRLLIEDRLKVVRLGTAGELEGVTVGENSLGISPDVMMMVATGFELSAVATYEAKHGELDPPQRDALMEEDGGSFSFLAYHELPFDDTWGSYESFRFWRHDRFWGMRTLPGLNIAHGAELFSRLLSNPEVLDILQQPPIDSIIELLHEPALPKGMRQPYLAQLVKKGLYTPS